MNLEKIGILIFIILSLFLTLLSIVLFAIPTHAETIDYTPQQVAEYVATQAHQYGIDPKLALYITWQESHWDCSAVGDHGTSFGCWQIHNPAQKGLTQPQAEDLIISTYWSLKTMVKDGGCRQWSTCPTSSSS